MGSLKSGNTLPLLINKGIKIIDELIQKGFINQEQHENLLKKLSVLSNNYYIMRKIETKGELIDYLTRVCAAYRKSYKLYGIINKRLIITGGILGSTAVLAVVPVIPVFVATISVVPAIIGIITNAT